MSNETLEPGVLEGRQNPLENAGRHRIAGVRIGAVETQSITLLSSSTEWLNRSARRVKSRPEITR